MKLKFLGPFPSGTFFCILNRGFLPRVIYRSTFQYSLSWFVFPVFGKAIQLIAFIGQFGLSQQASTPAMTIPNIPLTTQVVTNPKWLATFSIPPVCSATREFLLAMPSSNGNLFRVAVGQKHNPHLGGFLHRICRFFFYVPQSGKGILMRAIIQSPSLVCCGGFDRDQGQTQWNYKNVPEMRGQQSFAD